MARSNTATADNRLAERFDPGGTLRRKLPLFLFLTAYSRRASGGESLLPRRHFLRRSFPPGKKLTELARGYVPMVMTTRFPHMQGIALSGFGAAADIDQSQAAGYYGHLIKPIDVGELLGLLGQAAREVAG